MNTQDVRTNIDLAVQTSITFCVAMDTISFLKDIIERVNYGMSRKLLLEFLNTEEQKQESIRDIAEKRINGIGIDVDELMYRPNAFFGDPIDPLTCDEKDLPF